MATKERRKTPPGAPAYHRLTEEERIIIETLRKEGCSNRHIAERIGCSPATIGRELKRNLSEKGYRHKKAQSKANHRAAEKAAKRRKFTEEMWHLAMDRLAKGWTFEQIYGRCRRDGVTMVCAETLYKEYYKRQKLVLAGKSQEILPPLPKRKKKRKTRDRNAKKYRDAGRGKIKDRVDIDERPKTVENRARVGHLEGDLINGLKGTGNFVTLAERMTRFTFIDYAATKEADVVASVVIGLLASLPNGFLKTLTFDNGKEFALFKSIEQALGIKVYFAKPYHSWERGTNAVPAARIPLSNFFSSMAAAFCSNRSAPWSASSIGTPPKRLSSTTGFIPSAFKVRKTPSRQPRGNWRKRSPFKAREMTRGVP